MRDTLKRWSKISIIYLIQITGYPFENNIAGVSIITDKSIDADALSTTVFAKGLEEGLKFVETLPNVDAIFITKDNKVYITNGIRDSFTLENEDFTLENLILSKNKEQIGLVYYLLFYYI